IGNALQIPQSFQWLDFSRWAKKYGTRNIVYLEAFGQPLILLNSPKSAMDLLEQRSANYSDQPHL
ncbi:hypothetical protein B0H14DRAFT_2297207, partial [Mycena olivaceomarginata]